MGPASRDTCVLYLSLAHKYPTSEPHYITVSVAVTKVHTTITMTLSIRRTHRHTRTRARLAARIVLSLSRLDEGGLSPWPEMSFIV